MKTDIAHKPVLPFEVDPSLSVHQAIESMSRISFQGRKLGEALAVWEAMVEDPEAVISFGLAGALVPAGMRKIISFLITNRYIDVLVSTGANLFHDLHESLGMHHYMTRPDVDDIEFKKLGLDRIYDTYGSDPEFNLSDKYISDFAMQMEPGIYSTRKFIKLLGDKLLEDGMEDGILTSAAKAGVPIYCPAFADSSLAIALVAFGGHDRVIIEVVSDVKETAEIIINNKKSGVIFLGGGTPKNFIQQTEVTATMMGHKVEGHMWALQITTDSPHWGGLSGCTFSEAQSWGKIHKEANMVTLSSDATIALPLLVTALSQKFGAKLQEHRKPWLPEL